MNPVADIPNVGVFAPALEELMPQLLRLSADARLEVIARLSQSLKSSAPPPVPVPLPSFVGAWTNDPEADKMEAAIQASRHFTTKPALEGW